MRDAAPTGAAPARSNATASARAEGLDVVEGAGVYGEEGLQAKLRAYAFLGEEQFY